MKVIVFHGYGSRGDHPRWNELPERIETTVDYETQPFKEIYDHYDNLIKNYIDHNSVYCVAHSLGSLIAFDLVEKYGLTGIYFNPALIIPKPNITGMKELSNISNDIKGLRFQKNGKHLFYCETGDDVVDFSKLIKTMAKIGLTKVIPGGEHKIKYKENILKMFELAIAINDQ